MTMAWRPCPTCGLMPCQCPQQTALDEWLEKKAEDAGLTDELDAIYAINPPPPQLQGERVAFREWTVGEDLGLYSTGVGQRWEREMVADSSRCAPAAEFRTWQSIHAVRRPPGDVPTHEGSPHPNCLGCGLHAFYEVPEGLQYAEVATGLVGAIVVSGRTMLGPTGVRAEKARVVLLAYANDRQKVLADAASRKLGVGCCALADLERLALEYGQPVPDDEKPDGQAGFATGGLVPVAGFFSVTNNTLHGGQTPVTLTGGGGATAIKNLSIGVPSGRTVEVDGSTGEVAVRVDGQEWIPGPDPKREKLAKAYRDDKIALPIVILLALACLATTPFGGGWVAAVTGSLWSLFAGVGAMETKNDRRKLREYDAAKESS